MLPAFFGLPTCTVLSEEAV